MQTETEAPGTTFETRGRLHIHNKQQEPPVLRFPPPSLTGLKPLLFSMMSKQALSLSLKQYLQLLLSQTR